MIAKKLWSLIGLMLVFSMVAAGCGSGTSGPAANPGSSSNSSSGSGAATGATTAAGDNTNAAASGGNVSGDLRITWWGSQDRHDRTIKAIQLFEQQNPNVKITYEFAGFNPYWTKLTTQAAGGNLPCVMQQDYAYLSEWASRGLLMPLDPYVENGQLNLKNVAESQLSGGKIDGKLYGVNLGTNSQTFVADTGLFEKAGVKLPDPTQKVWTWDDFMQITTQIQNKLGIYGMGEALYDSQVFKAWLIEQGKQLYSNDGKSLGYEDDKLFVDFFNMVLQLQKSGAIPTREFDVSRGQLSVEDQLLATQKAAQAYIWSNQVVALSKAASDRPLSLNLLPQVPNGPSGNYLKPSMFFSVTSQCKNPEAAVKFIDWFTNSIDANKILLAERGVPISSEVRDALKPLLQPAQQQTFDYINLVEKNSSPIPPPDPAGASNVINSAYTPIIDQMLYGQISPEDAAKQFRQQANDILSK